MLDHDFHALLDRLRNGTLATNEIGPTIVRLAKPFDQTRINAASDVVASYVDHPDNWVRHEVIWFLACWGRLGEYQASIVERMLRDPDVDNRAYAALCLGTLCQSNPDPAVIAALCDVVLDETASPTVRLNAYGALLQCGKKESSVEFQAGMRGLGDVDWDWVRSIAGTSR